MAKSLPVESLVALYGNVVKTWARLFFIAVWDRHLSSGYLFFYRYLKCLSWILKKTYFTMIYLHIKTMLWMAYKHKISHSSCYINVMQIQSRTFCFSRVILESHLARSLVWSLDGFKGTLWWYSATCISLCWHQIKTVSCRKGREMLEQNPSMRCW